MLLAIAMHRRRPSFFGLANLYDHGTVLRLSGFGLLPDLSRQQGHSIAAWVYAIALHNLLGQRPMRNMFGNRPSGP